MNIPVLYFIVILLEHGAANEELDINFSKFGEYLGKSFDL